MINHECSCHKEGLVSTLYSAISRCDCGIYHIHIDPVTLHLTPSQFEATARLFKLALGIAAARRLEEKDARHADRKGPYKREEVTVQGAPILF